jgi:exopolysaccharide biosynthesis protein
MNNKHPRTAAGITAAGEVVLVTMDGRTPAGIGVTLDELATYMTWLSCDEAMNFDGGGSTTMWVSGQPALGVVNYPSDAEIHHQPNPYGHREPELLL